MRAVSKIAGHRTTLSAGFVLAMLTASPARAAEVVTLRSGFTLTCTSREAISATTVRLYLSSNPAGTANYMDIPISAVAAIDLSPDLVIPPAPGTQPTLDGILQRSGATHNVNVALLASVIYAESAGNTRALSRTGARGLMQLMPGTATELGVSDSFAPEQNVNGGSAYLDRLLTRYHENVALALAAYNAGPGAVDRYHGIPPYRETRMYVARVLREFNRLVRLQAAAAVPATAAGVTHTMSR